MAPLEAPTAATADYLMRLERELAGGLQQMLVLGLVARKGPIHGYGLIKELEATAGGQGFWKEGTIYPLLGSLEREGLVRSRWGTPTTGPRRKYYELTAAGRQVLRFAAIQWGEIRSAVDQVVQP